MNDEDQIEQTMRDGRHVVARALVERVYGAWYDHPPYTELAQEIVDDPYCGVDQALAERDRQRACAGATCNDLTIGRVAAWLRSKNTPDAIALAAAVEWGELANFKEQA